MTLRIAYFLAGLWIAFWVKVASADILFTWTNCPNWLAGSPTYVWQGAVSPLHYSKRFVAQANPTNSFTFKETALHEGFNYFAIQQQATNTDGSVGMTDFSGEVQVIKRPMIELATPIMTSTNLGQTWVEATNQRVVFPTDAAQRFFITGQMRASRVSQLTFPPHP